MSLNSLCSLSAFKPVYILYSKSNMTLATANPPAPISMQCIGSYTKQWAEKPLICSIQCRHIGFSKSSCGLKIADFQNASVESPSKEYLNHFQGKTYTTLWSYGLASHIRHSTVCNQQAPSRCSLSSVALDLTISRQV